MFIRSDYLTNTVNRESDDYIGFKATALILAADYDISNRLLLTLISDHYKCLI